MLAARFIFLGFFTALAGVAPAADAKKVTYEDDVLPIFRDNCLKCHNPDKLKGDLDLTSFSAVVKGGGSGATLNPGDPDGSLLFKSITHAEEPEMPPKAKLSDKEIATIRQWIAGGMLQGANSKALAANKPTVDLALKAGAIGKPDGPPPMPGPLSLEPFVRATRGSALAALAASPWAPVVALAGPHQISLYHTGDLEFLGVLPFPEGLPCDVKFSRNGKLLLAGGGRGGHSGLVAVWDIAKAERVITIGDQFDSVLAADISSDQQWIALGGPDRILKIYQTKDGALAHRLKKHTEWVTAVEFSPDSKFLATGDRNGGLVLWEAASGQEMFNLPGHRGAITAITWRSDSELVASSSEDGSLKLWKASDGSALRSINANPGGSLSARFTHDGRIVTCGRDNKVQIWDVSGKNLLNLAFTGDLPNRVTFTDDGKKVIGSDWQGKVTVWDAKTGKPVGELESFPPSVNERVQLAAQKVATLKQELSAAAANIAKAEASAKAAAEAENRAKTAVADGKTRLSAEAAAVKKATAALAQDSAAEPLKQQLAEANSRLTAAKTQSAALQKTLAGATQQVAAANKKIAEAKSAHDALTAKLAAAVASHAKWQAVPPTPRSATGKLTSVDRPAR